MANGLSKSVRIIGGIIAVLGILIIGMILTLYFIDWNHFRGFIADKSHQMTGRPLVIHGDLDVKLGLSPIITAEQITYGNAPWGLTQQMFKADRVLFEVRLLPLLVGRVELPQLALNDVSVLLERNKAGIGNWQLDPEAPPEPIEPEDMIIPLLGEASIRNARFGYIDHADTQHVDAHLDHFLLAATADDTLDAPMEMSSKGTVAGLPFGLQGVLGSLDELADSPEPFPLHIEGRLADVAIEASGHIQEPLRPQGVELEFSTRAENVQQILRAFEIQADKIQAELIPPLRASGGLVQNGTRWSIVDLDAAFGDSLFLGELLFEPRERPYLSVNIHSPRVNLNDFANLLPETPPRPPDVPLFTEDPLPLDFLKAYDADIDLRVQRIVGAGLGGELVNDARVRAALHEGKLVVRPFHADIVDGNIKAGAIIDASLEAPRLASGISVQRLALSQVIEEVDPVEQVEGWVAEQVMELTEQIAGHLGGTIVLRAQGRSPREIAKDLEGRIDFAMEHGKFSYVLKRLMALDLGRGLIQWLAGDEPVLINCFFASFDINKGMLNTETMLLATEVVNAWGEGWMDIPKERVDFTLHALPRTPGIGSLRTPLVIEGEFRELSVYPKPVPLITRALGGLVETGPGEERVCAQYLDEIREVKE